MIKTKQKLILSEGTPVQVREWKSGNAEYAHALLGRASKQFNVTVSLETQRRALLLPEVTIDSGYIVKDQNTGENHVVVATYDEIIRGVKATTVCMMVKCNATLDVSGDDMVADDNGNIQKVPVVKCADMPIYAQGITFDLIQYQPGLQEDAKYILYAPAVAVNTLDRVVIKSGGVVVPLKVTTTDYVSYPGLVLIQAHTETRM